MATSVTPAPPPAAADVAVPTELSRSLPSAGSSCGAVAGAGEPPPAQLRPPAGGVESLPITRRRRKARSSSVKRADALAETRLRSRALSAYLDMIPAGVLLGTDNPQVLAANSAARLDPSAAKATSQVLEEAARCGHAPTVKGDADAAEEINGTGCKSAFIVQKKKRRRRKNSSPAPEESASGTNGNASVPRSVLHAKLERRIAELKEERRRRQSETEKARQLAYLKSRQDSATSCHSSPSMVATASPRITPADAVATPPVPVARDSVTAATSTVSAGASQTPGSPVVRPAAPWLRPAPTRDAGAPAATTGAQPPGSPGSSRAPWARSQAATSSTAAPPPAPWTRPAFSPGASRSPRLRPKGSPRLGPRREPQAATTSAPSGSGAERYRVADQQQLKPQHQHQSQNPQQQPQPPWRVQQQQNQQQQQQQQPFRRSHPRSRKSRSVPRRSFKRSPRPPRLRPGFEGRRSNFLN